ncbi:MAG: phosphoglucosamine mutase [Gammaproteobacteria bacterium RIFCSPHIGHO2_12_FULL_45_12]|nr:MAG: phosphoglucosamine mutase [Gammaproteobacteria bacterium RIFCSPHIGHO2_12_FULL_45_12]
MTQSSRQRQFFGTDGIRGRVGIWPITPEFVLKLGWAVGKVLARQGNGKVLIGKDTRISGYMFESVLESGLSAAGIDTHLLGPMPTPAIAYLTRTLRAQAGIVISASHNPYFDNGIKFFSAQGTKLADEIELAIEEQLEQVMTTVDSAALGKAIRVVDAPGRYIEFCKSTVSSDVTLNGLKIVVDCANGAAYHIAPNVFRELGADVYELGVEPNGLNINLNCGANHPETVKQAVLEQQADLGISLDGDGDRVVMVDHHGHILDGDDLLYIIAKHKASRGSLLGGVVGTVMSNLGLEKALQQLGLELVRVPVGDRYILRELMSRHWNLGGEPSGHIVCLGATSTGDGIVTALQVLAAMRCQRMPLAEIRVGIDKYPQVLVNVGTGQGQAGKSLESPGIKQAVAEVEAELGGRGRVLLRCSGTEPLIRIMVEGEDEQRVRTYANQLAQVLKSEIG